MSTSAENPTLIVRHDPAHLQEALEETRMIMERIGEPDAIVQPAQVAGNLKVIPEGDPHEAQEAIIHLVSEAPEMFRHTSSWTVVDRWVQSDLESIRKAVANYQREIGASDSWRVAVRPSETGLHRQAVIDAIAPLIHNAPVDLDNPSKEIRIDILGDETGVGLLGRNEVFRHP